MDLGSKIRELRKEKGMKQSELAEKAGLSRVSVGNYERNERIPDAEILSRLATALDSTPSELMGWSKSRSLEIENLRPKYKKELEDVQYLFYKEASKYWTQSGFDTLMENMDIKQFFDYLHMLTNDIDINSFNSFVDYLSKTFPNSYKVGLENLIKLHNKVIDFTEFNLIKLADKNKEGE
jgi:transcriptional regulator with XRE-family HTH domain